MSNYLREPSNYLFILIETFANAPSLKINRHFTLQYEQ